MTPRLHSLKRRFGRWELGHLRQHAAELAQRLEDAEKRAAEAEDRASAAESACDFWHDQAVAMHHAAAEEAGGTRGITMAGHLCVVPGTRAGRLHA